MTHQTYYRHEKAGAPGAANPALPLEYVSARLRGQVTKVAIGAAILILFPQRESGLVDWWWWGMVFRPEHIAGAHVRQSCSAVCLKKIAVGIGLVAAGATLAFRMFRGMKRPRWA